MSQTQGAGPLPTHQMDCYIENRAKFAVEELAKHRGQWIAFSPDGSRILDGCENLASLRDRLDRAGIDLEAVVFERVPTDDMILSGSELS